MLNIAKLFLSLSLCALFGVLIHSLPDPLPVAEMTIHHWAIAFNACAALIAGLAVLHTIR